MHEDKKNLSLDTKSREKADDEVMQLALLTGTFASIATLLNALLGVV